MIILSVEWENIGNAYNNNSHVPLEMLHKKLYNIIIKTTKM